MQKNNEGALSDLRVIEMGQLLADSFAVSFWETLVLR